MYFWVLILFNLVALAIADSPATTDSYYLQSGDFTLPTQTTEQIYTIQTIVPTSSFFTCTGTHWSDCAGHTWAHSHSFMHSYMYSFTRCDEVCTGARCTRCWSAPTLVSALTIFVPIPTSVLSSSSSTAASTGATIPSITTATSISVATSASALAASTGAASNLRPVLVGAVRGGFLAGLLVAA
ncbi:hypothetical protein AOQ84DRAFT_73408 [Glonium stellatum]|uniref:Uncharacterized protein n=1 Tax=Glonium stellatum TaxID=574774 RepID=A0A8E2EXF4_9PEZI|nr:hypothetical protein AOQ84DRAFT_73408 [Glonium stellatum]